MALMMMGISSLFAPHRRGSTAVAAQVRKENLVCPAQAGVYLWKKHITPASISLPRTGGGLPPILKRLGMRDSFAPHRRGSTRDRPNQQISHAVCPAQAGVYPSERKL